MRKLIVLACFLASTGMLLAQRGGGGFGHGASFGHSEGASFGHAGTVASHFRGGSTGFAASRPASRGYAQAPRYAYRPSSTGYAGAGARPEWNRNRRVGYPRVYGYPYGYAGYGYGYLGFDPYLTSYLNAPLQLGDDDPNDPNLQSNAADTNAGSYAGPYEDGYSGPPMDAARPPYEGSGERYGSAQQLQPQADALQQPPKVQLIFKDGHKMEIQDYVATKTRILVTEGGTNREILVASLDVPATLAANQAAGVDFAIPGNPVKWQLSPEDLKTY